MGIDRDVVAHHEAGHAVAAHVLGVNVERVAIQPEGGAAGHVVHEYGCNMNDIITKRGMKPRRRRQKEIGLRGIQCRGTGKTRRM